MAGVVHLAVPVLDRPDDPPRSEPGSEGEGPTPGELAVERQAGRRPAAAGEQVVEEDPCPDVGALVEPVAEGEEERDRVDQVGRDPEQDRPLAEGLADEGEVVELEVAQAAVDELGGAAGGARRPVLGLHDPDPQAPGRGVEGGAGADDPPAHHQQVEGLGAEDGEVGGVALGGEPGHRGRAHGRSSSCSIQPKERSTARFQPA